MTNKEIQRRRMMMYFIEAADKLIEEEGMEGVSLRKVARGAGYNSATLYNYFENLDHLIFYAAMKYIKDYAMALKNYLKGTENAMDRFLKVWECFCDYAYDKPEIYNAIFFPKLDKDVEHYVREYYELFPDELNSDHATISTMLLKRNLSDRAMTIMDDCVDEGYIDLKDAECANDMTLVIFEGILKRVLNNKITYNNARNNTMEYFKVILKQFLIKDYQFYY